VKRAGGFTLVELVVAITIVGIVSTTVLGVMSATAARSGDSMVSNQAVMIAHAYLQEIMSQQYYGPSRQTSRAAFDDVDDYHGLVDIGAVDPSGRAIAGLSKFRIDVTVTPGSWGTPVVAAKLIQVRVTDPLNRVTTIRAYRTSTP
jgi:MSHA pilin protein MshD